MARSQGCRQDLPCSASAKTSLPATVTLAVHPAGNPQPRLHSCSGDNQPSEAHQHFPCPGTGLKDTATVLALLLYSSSSLRGSGHIHCSDSPPAGSSAYAPQPPPRLQAGLTAVQRDLPVLSRRLGGCLLQALQARSQSQASAQHWVELLRAHGAIPRLQ